MNQGFPLISIRGNPHSPRVLWLVRNKRQCTHGEIFARLLRESFVVKIGRRNRLKKKAGIRLWRPVAAVGREEGGAGPGLGAERTSGLGRLAAGRPLIRVGALPRAQRNPLPFHLLQLIGHGQSWMDEALSTSNATLQSERGPKFGN